MNRVHYEPGMPFGTLQTFDLLHVSVQQKPQWKTSKNNMSSAKKSFQCCFMLLSFGKHQQRCQFCSIHANLISHSWACAHLLCVFFFKCSLQHLPPGFIQTIIKQEGNTITKLLKPPLQQQFQRDLHRNSEHKKNKLPLPFCPGMQMQFSSFSFFGDIIILHLDVKTAFILR